MMFANDVEKWDSLGLTRYRFLKSLGISKNLSAAGECVVELILSDGTGLAATSIRLRCKNTINIKLGDLNGVLGMLLLIEDVRSDQLEGVAFRVSEEEYHAFSFLCGEFCVTLEDDEC